MAQRKIITKQGLKKLQDELAHRVEEERKGIADKLDEAKAQGDLSENSAYTSALEEYHMNEARIKELRKILSELVIAPDRQGNSRIDVGDTVKLKDISDGKMITYKMVGEGEGDPLKGQISSKSKLGVNIIGKKLNDKVKIVLPSGNKEYKIVFIS